MIAFKVPLLILIFAAVFCAQPGQVTKDFMKTYVKSCRCNISEKYIHKNVSCFAKSYNRSFSTINMYGLAKRPVPKIFVSNISDICYSEIIILKWVQVDIDIQYKYGTIYREVIRSPRIDLCKLLDEKDFSNKLVSTLLQLVNDTSPGLVHNCPYQVCSWTKFLQNRRYCTFLQLINVTKRDIKTDALLSVFATGEYKMHFHFLAGNLEKMVSVSLAMDVLSSDRNSFG